MIYGCAYYLPAVIVALLWWLVTNRRNIVIPVSLIIAFAFLMLWPEVQANPPLWLNPTNGFRTGLPLAVAVTFAGIFEFAMDHVAITRKKHP